MILKLASKSIDLHPAAVAYVHDSQELTRYQKLQAVYIFQWDTADGGYLIEKARDAGYQGIKILDPLAFLHGRGW